ncbi:MAG: XRE family transcriptional regulator [Brevundimonas sp.]|nr:MAG: XRE family transcriptional regulator [Brevundimonas sp.]
MVALKGSRSPKDREFDDAVGARIRHYRLGSGLSQSVVAQAAGITFQQLQKYESGDNRVAASRLAAIAASLGVPVSRLLGEGEDPPMIREAFAADELQLLSNYRRAAVNGKRALRMLAATLAEMPATD